MKSLRQLLPSANALVVFESAARLASFTRAAEELGISQPAVSRHVANLEDFVGRPLFERRHNRLALTDVGAGLRDAVSLGLGHVAAALEAARDVPSPQELRIACNFGFAYTWLMPRFSRLREVLADRSPRLITSDVALDYDSGDIDVSIRFGNGQWPGRRARQIISEAVVPVATPDVAARYGLDAATPASDLPPLPLLHFDRGIAGWLTWPLWFEAQGISHAPKETPYYFGNYAFLLQAALEGRGIALGWRSLIDPYLDGGSLVVVGPQVERPGHGYWLVWNPDYLPASVAERMSVWFDTELSSDARVTR
ncbi:MAG: LysR family transcriptional regulator [Alphaproteobacteria bacterium]|nr:LysR family transcriptional regulator [Alphaproteobacteria bacterium]